MAAHLGCLQKDTAKAANKPFAPGETGAYDAFVAEILKTTEKVSCCYRALQYKGATASSRVEMALTRTAASG